MPLSHEKLIAYQKSLDFCGWVESVLEGLPSRAVRDQLDRASTSIPLNLAEGNGKFSKLDRARFWQIAHGSAVESSACLDVLVVKKLRTSSQVAKGKAMLEEIVRLIFGLLDHVGCRLQENVDALEVDWHSMKPMKYSAILSQTKRKRQRKRKK